MRTATTDKENIDFAIKEMGSSSTTSKTKANSSSFNSEAISNRELPQEIEEVITDTWRTSTRSIFEFVLKRCKCCTLLWNENHYITSIESVLTFLHGTYNGGCLCSSLCVVYVYLQNYRTILY